MAQQQPPTSPHSSDWWQWLLGGGAAVALAGVLGRTCIWVRDKMLDRILRQEAEITRLRDERQAASDAESQRLRAEIDRLNARIVQLESKLGRGLDEDRI